MNGTTCTCYHTTCKENTEKIIKNGFSPSKSGKKHWLGKGVYFFNDIYYSIEWGIIGVIKQDISEYTELCKKCDILESKIDFEHYQVLDISSPSGYDTFLKLLEILKKKYSKEEYTYIIEQGDAYIIEILEKLEQKEKIKYLSQFDIISAVYNKRIYRKEYKTRSDFWACPEMQICVKNTQAIVETKRIKIEDSLKIQKLFKLVIKNRGGRNDQ